MPEVLIQYPMAIFSSPLLVRFSNFSLSLFRFRRSRSVLSLETFSDAIEGLESTMLISGKQLTKHLTSLGLFTMMTFTGRALPLFALKILKSLTQRMSVANLI